MTVLQGHSLVNLVIPNICDRIVVVKYLFKPIFEFLILFKNGVHTTFHKKRRPWKVVNQVECLFNPNVFE